MVVACVGRFGGGVAPASGHAEMLAMFEVHVLPGFGVLQQGFRAGFPHADCQQTHKVIVSIFLVFPRRVKSMALALLKRRNVWV
jgi:hypothetical protein